MATEIQLKERNGIQALRAIACALVLFQHVTYYAAFSRGIPYEPFLPINFGRMGVDLFFVISGFVMGQCLGDGPAFMLHRVGRIFPPFWGAVLLSFLVLGVGQTDWHLDAWSLALLPPADLNNSYMIPYWTLCYEIAFYVAVYLLILLRVPRRVVPSVCLAWIMVIVLFNAYRPLGGFDADAANHFIFYPGWLIPLSPVTLLFVSGLMLATLPPVPATVGPAILAITAIVIWTAALGAPFPTATPNYLLLAVAYGATLLAAQRVQFPRFAVRLGDVSYGFYLVHVIAIAAVLRAIQHSGTSPRFAMTWAMMAGAAIVLGLSYGWLESQFHNRVVKRLFRRHHKTVEALPTPAAGRRRVS